MAVGRAGLGSFPRPHYDRQLVQDEIHAEVEEQRCRKMVRMSKQGVWTRWEHVEPRKITWAKLWRAEPLWTKFLIQSVYDVLPSPANLHTWGLANTFELLPKGFRRGLVSLAPRLSFKIHCGFHLHSEHCITASPRSPCGSLSPSLEQGRI